MTVIYAREGFAEDLWRYGEPDLAVAMLATDDATYRRVMDAAANPAALSDDTRDSVSMAEMCALGAIEVLTGSPRPPARKRRLPESSLNDLWDRVGRAADRRGEDDGMDEAMRVADGD